MQISKCKIFKTFITTKIHVHQLGHYVIYLQNMKFVRSILWPGGAYTDASYANAARIMIPYSDEIMNHDYIGSLACMPNEPTRGTFAPIIPVATL